MSLELKVPPPVVAIALAAAMYGVSEALPGLDLRFPASRALAALLAAAGLAVMLSAAFLFLRHRTTIDPRKPERSSTLLTGGVYRWSRNPIYLADVLLLLAWATYLAHPLALALVPAFVAWMNAFQIAPEERILRERFGVAYEDYRRRVGRWLGPARQGR